jgi:sec-independent protein translocase protein TatB
MFDIGGSELLVVAVVALLVVGPKELPALLRTVGRAITAIKRQAQEFREQFDEALRESEFADLKNSVDELKSEATSGLRDLGKEVEKEVDDVKTVGNDLSREIEDSTKQDHDLDWLDEYENATASNESGKPHSGAAGDPGDNAAAPDPALLDQAAASPTTPAAKAADAASDTDKPSEVESADDGHEPPQKAAGAAT